MFSFFKRIFLKCFGRKEVDRVKSNKKKDTSNKKVDFNARLIKHLVDDHRVLLADFTEMMASANEGDYNVTNHLLGAFATKLVAHLNKENIELYTFLGYMVKMSPEDKESISGFRSEMAAIEVAVTGLINKYTNQEVSTSNIDSFITDFDGVATVFVDRIGREEKMLYPLYHKYKK